MSVEKISLDLNHVRSQFEAWRASRIRRKPIPENLWSAAIALLELYPFRIVCRELRLNPKYLRKRCGGILPPQAKQSKEQKGKGQFLELSGQSLISSSKMTNNS